METIHANQRVIETIKILLNNYQVTIDGIDTIDIDIGLPQGTKIAPILFILLFNKILNSFDQELP